MANQRSRLELVWLGKKNEPRPEPSMRVAEAATYLQATFRPLRQSRDLRGQPAQLEGPRAGAR